MDSLVLMSESKCTETSRSKPGRHASLSFLQRWDVFDKKLDDVQVATKSGGVVTMLTVLVMIFLMSCELMHYTDIEHSTSYRVDVMRQGTNKMEIHVDLDIKSKCDLIASDVIDLSGGMLQSSFTKIPIVFDLTHEQSQWWREKQKLAEANRTVLGDEHAPPVYVFDSTKPFINALDMPEIDIDDSVVHDGCRIHGSVNVTMVKGNIHFTGGSLKENSSGSHIHVNIPLAEMNFTHRIRQLSFSHPGKHYPGLVSELEGSETVINNMLGCTQYMLQVVPTEYKYTRANWASLDDPPSMVKDWYTYSYLKEAKNGFPGIFFTFDINPVKMHVKESQHSLLSVTIRLIGLIGGIFATSDMIHRFAVGVFSSMQQTISSGDLEGMINSSTQTRHSQHTPKVA